VIGEADILTKGDNPGFIVTNLPKDGCSERLVPTAAFLPLRVEPRDSMRYCFVDSRLDKAFATAVDAQSDPDLGLVNRDIPLARALLGAAIRQERYVAFSHG
jgi:hypothetical protein